MIPDPTPLTFWDWLPFIMCVCAGGLIAVMFVLSIAGPA